MTIAFQQLAAALVLWQADTGQLGPVSQEQFQSGKSLVWMFVQTVIALGFVCLLAYVVLRVVLPRFNLAGAGKSMVRIVDRTPLDQRRSLYVIEVTGRWMLVGVSEAGVQLIGELDGEKAEYEAEALKESAAFNRARISLDQAKSSARTAFEGILSRKANRR
jgi:flagellar biosynthetic protein FliO